MAEIEVFEIAFDLEADGPAQARTRVLDVHIKTIT